MVVETTVWIINRVRRVKSLRAERRKRTQDLKALSEGVDVRHGAP